MFATRHSAARAYASVGLETDVAAADPHKLVLMLFEGALLAITQARMHMEQKNIAAKGEAVSKAISIIDQGLKASLDVKAGGAMAEKLHALYEYMCHRLVLANLDNRQDILEEVARLLRDLHGAWASIGTAAREGAEPRLTLAHGKR